MPNASELLEWTRTNPAVAVPAFAALLAAMVGGLLQLFGHWLHNRAAVAIQQMKLRHAIAEKWLADFEAQARKVRALIDALIVGSVVRTGDDVSRLEELVMTYTAAVKGLVDRALMLSLNSPSRLVLDAAR